MNDQDCIDEINLIRNDLNGLDLRDVHHRGNISALIKNTTHLSRYDIAQALSVDLLEGDDLNRTKSIIIGENNNFVVSVFHAPYFPTLTFDGFFYETISINKAIASSYETPVRPVKLTHQSNGFEYRAVVALFPENHIDNVQLSSDRIFYFIDKFVIRHKKITQKLLSTCVSKDSFLILRNMVDSQIQEMSTYWVWLHEYFHRKGFLPIPRYLKLKSTKALAGLEEMRVDLLAMSSCQNDPVFSGIDSRMLFEFILSERLLRYPIEGIEIPNYDAISSQLLFVFLLENGGITLDNGLIEVQDSIVDVVQLLSDKINSIEALIETKSEKFVQDALLEFIMHYAQFDTKLNDFTHLAFYENIRTKYLGL